MLSTAQIDEKWVDIVPLDVPLHSMEPWAIMVAASLPVVLIALGIFFYSRPRQRARRALLRLAHDLQRSQPDIKSAALSIRHYLAEGFGQHQLQAVPLSHAHQAEWQNYLNRLSRYCFAAQPPATVELNAAIDEALDWLNKKTLDTE